MILLTAPSKTQLAPAEIPPLFTDFTLPQLLEKSAQLIAELKPLTTKELAALMKTSDRLTEATYRQIQQFTTPFHQQNASHAIRTFRGDVYEAISSDNYTKAQLDYCQHHLIILSGLYGLLRPLDLMQPYRLEMGLKFSPCGTENLYHFWREKVTDKVLAQLIATDETTLVNLASAEYAKVIDKKRLVGEKCRMVEIIFQQPHPKGKEGYKIIPIHSKRARGEMIHFAIINGVTTAEDLLEFTVGGYAFVRQNSTENTWVFRQKHPL